MSVFGYMRTEWDGDAHEYKLAGHVDGELTLRDYFAAKAMQSMLRESINKEGFATVHGISSDAYKMADAMLEERAKE